MQRQKYTCNTQKIMIVEANREKKNQRSISQYQQVIIFNKDNSLGQKGKYTCIKLLRSKQKTSILLEYQPHNQLQQPPSEIPFTNFTSHYILWFWKPFQNSRYAGIVFDQMPIKWSCSLRFPQYLQKYECYISVFTVIFNTF